MAASWDRKMLPNNKVALITGITGQDGSYLAEFLLEKGYVVHGLIRRSSSFNTGRIEHLYADKFSHTGGNAEIGTFEVHLTPKFFIPDSDLHLHYGDVTDTSCLMSILMQAKPSEVYNLAAMSHVKVSFEVPEYTANADGVGVLRILEAIKACDLLSQIRFYQASTSEMYGKVQEVPQTEKTPFYPRSPYGVAKLYGYWITVNYREAYGAFACNGVLFNHESPRRGENFVTRKITRTVAKIHLGLQEDLVLGNLDAIRDWGHAADYVKAMWLMMQQDVPDDYVIATGETHTVREFVEKSFECAGITIVWEGEKGIKEVGKDKATGVIRVRVSEKYYRPTEVDLLQGSPAKAEKVLKWKRSVTFDQLVKEMMQSDLDLMKKTPTA